MRPLSSSAPDAASPESLARRQRVRLRRLLIGVAVYGCSVPLLLALAWLGLLSPGFAPVWIAAVAAVNLAFYALIRSGVNLRFSDPSMTMVQMTVSIVTIAFILYHVQAARGVLLVFMLVNLFFGALELRTSQLFAVGAMSSLAYAIVIALLWTYRPASIDFRIEWLQWVTVTATLMVMCPLVGYFSDMRRRLSASLATIREMAHRDALTGVFNRRHLTDMLDREVNRSERSGSPFLLAVVDIDHFKRVNDKHGHLAGDAALCAVAQVLSATLRKSDYLARFGGEEFVLLLDVDGNEGARVVCERLRTRVEALRVAELKGEPITVSIGVSFHRRGDTPATLMARADDALYAAKEGGRNRMTMASEAQAQAEAVTASAS